MIKYIEWIRREYVEGPDMITLDNRPKATGRKLSGHEVVARYGIAAFQEISDKGSFVKPDREK